MVHFMLQMRTGEGNGPTPCAYAADGACVCSYVSILYLGRSAVVAYRRRSRQQHYEPQSAFVVRVTAGTMRPDLTITKCHSRGIPFYGIAVALLELEVMVCTDFLEAHLLKRAKRGRALAPRRERASLPMHAPDARLERRY